jgi:hypothetical protein
MCNGRIEAAEVHPFCPPALRCISISRSLFCASTVRTNAIWDQVAPIFQGHWKSGNDHQHDDSLRQRRHFEDWKNLRDNLHEQPARHSIGGANLIDMAPLHSAKKDFIRATAFVARSL